MKHRPRLYTEILNDVQKYIDEPVYKILKPRAELISTIAQAVATAFNSTVPQEIRILTGYNRFTLRWMKPGKDGALIPK